MPENQISSLYMSIERNPTIVFLQIQNVYRKVLNGPIYTELLEVSVPIEWSDLLYINMFQLIKMGDFYLCQRLQLLNYI